LCRRRRSLHTPRRWLARSRVLHPAAAPAPATRTDPCPPLRRSNGLLLLNPPLEKLDELAHTRRTEMGADVRPLWPARTGPRPQFVPIPPPPAGLWSSGLTTETPKIVLHKLSVVADLHPFHTKTRNTVSVWDGTRPRVFTVCSCRDATATACAQTPPEDRLSPSE
jgi:hypothetical protein